MKSLNEKLQEQRDELAKAERIYEPKYGGKDYSGYDTLMKYEVNYEREECFAKGFDAALKAQAEVSSVDVEFDEEAASDEGYKLNFINAVDSLQNVAFVRGARYQHQQNCAALSAIKGENEFLKTLIAQSNYRTENELEKLRAEKANEWKKMDEAKDAFACTVDQLNAAVDQQAIEIDKLRETLLAMKQTNDMDKAIIDGMRGVVAMARVVNNQRPDPRVTHQLKRFGADKLSDYRDDEIEKLRAEKANEWKRMDEAKDAFFRVIDQLSAAVDQQAIEVNKLSELKGK